MSDRDKILGALRASLEWDWPAVPAEHIPASEEVLGEIADAIVTALTPKVNAILCGGNPTDEDLRTVAAVAESMSKVPQPYRSSQGASRIWADGYVAGVMAS